MINILIKHREETKELQILKALHNRIDEIAIDSIYFTNLQKGYEGEISFDHLIQQFPINSLVLNDLLLEISNTTFQMDTLMITDKKVYLFEVKNFEGDFYVDGDKWYTISKSEISNPLLQLKRSESLLRRLLQQLRYSDFTIESYLVFINPEFLLYNSPFNDSVIFRPQLNRFLKTLAKQSVNISNRTNKLAELLMSLHLHESPFMRLPSYSFDQLQKGILCEICCSFIDAQLTCPKCGNVEEDESIAITRALSDFTTLFPDKKITTNVIHEWCDVVKSKKKIRKILSENYEKKGNKKYTYYIKTTI